MVSEKARALYEIASYHLEEIQKVIPGAKVRFIASYDDDPKKSMTLGDLDTDKAVEILKHLKENSRETLVVEDGKVVHERQENH